MEQVAKHIPRADVAWLGHRLALLSEEQVRDGFRAAGYAPNDVEMYTKARRSVVAARAIPAGRVITREMLTVKRPGYGVKPKFIDVLVGRVARVDIDEDDIVMWEMV